MGARILVADDSVTIQKVVELTFSKEDFTLTQARSGEEAIRRAKELRPDLVLLDLVMPDMNGYDVCAALRAEPALRSVPVILLAGTFEAFDQQRGTQVGANDFVTKPFESQVLIGKVKQLLFAKAMETDRTAASARPSGDAVTVKLAHAQPSVGAAAPPSAASAVTQPLTPVPPVPKPPGEVWRSRESVPPASSGVTPPEPPAGVNAETIAMERLPAEPERAPLDVGAIELEPLPVPTESAADALDVLPLPESLSLDELLGVEPEVTPASARSSEPAMSGSEPVFELTETDAAPLPMVEVGKGEPAALSVEDLLGPDVGASAPADTLTLELPELDLTALSEVPSPAPAGEALAGAPFAEASAEPPEIPAAEPSVEQLTGAAAREPLKVAPSGAPRGVEMLQSVAEPVYSGAPEMRPSGAEETDLVALPATEQRSSDVVPPHEMAAMRDAVTARVAEELRHELSEKLLDRFEKIVWEVVPDLAEILITKEIERIRRLAEEERQS